MLDRLQYMPNDYLIYAVPGTTDRVQYFSRGTSTFSSTFHYGAFPFDRQRLQFRIATEVRLSKNLLLQEPIAAICKLKVPPPPASAHTHTPPVPPSKKKPNFFIPCPNI